jgi:hypothetical protein
MSDKTSLFSCEDINSTDFNHNSFKHNTNNHKYNNNFNHNIQINNRETLTPRHNNYNNTMIHSPKYMNLKSNINPSFIPRPVIDYTENSSNSDLDGLLVTSEMDPKNVKYLTNEQINDMQMRAYGFNPNPIYNTPLPYNYVRMGNSMSNSMSNSIGNSPSSKKIPPQVFFPHDVTGNINDKDNNNIIQTNTPISVFNENDKQFCNKSSRVAKDKYGNLINIPSTPKSSYGYYMAYNMVNNFGHNYNNSRNINSLEQSPYVTDNIHFKQPSSYHLTSPRYSSNDINSIPLPVSSRINKSYHNK